MNLQVAPLIQSTYDELLLAKTEIMHNTTSDVTEDVVKIEENLAESILLFQQYTHYYMITLVPNSMLMYFKLFK